MSESIATLELASDVFDAHAKLLRVLVKAGVTREQLMTPVQNHRARRNLAAYLAAGCPNLPANGAAPAAPPPVEPRTLSAAYQRVAAILGDDLITPEDIMDARSSIAYSDELLRRLEETLPDDAELAWLRDNNYMLVPGPAAPLSLLDIRGLNAKSFYSKSGGWYSEGNQRFARDDKVNPGWLKLRKGEVPGSPSKTWDEQTPLLTEVEHVPNAAEVAWGITLYHAIRDTYLLKGMYVRTSSLTANGDHVYVGSFDPSGIDVYDCWDYSQDGGLGIASARK